MKEYLNISRSSTPTNKISKDTITNLIKYSKQDIGQLAESKACQFLQAKGLLLLTHNYRCQQGEIDLIMQDKNAVVFVEVRSRNSSDFVHAADTITLRKQKKIIKTAFHFLQKKKWLYQVTSRFDVIAIHFIAGQTKLEWIKNAFLAQD